MLCYKSIVPIWRYRGWAPFSVLLWFLLRPKKFIPAKLITQQLNAICPGILFQSDNPVKTVRLVSHYVEIQTPQEQEKTVKTDVLELYIAQLNVLVNVLSLWVFLQ